MGVFMGQKNNSAQKYYNEASEVAQSIWSVFKKWRIERKEKSKTTPQKSDLSLISTLNIVINIITVSRYLHRDGTRAKVINKTDYMRSVAYFVGMSILLTCATSFVVYSNVVLFKALVDTLVSGTQSLYILLFAYTFFCTKIAHILNFLVGLTHDCWQSLCVRDFSFYMIKGR